MTKWEGTSSLALHFPSSSQRDWKGGFSSLGYTAWKPWPERMKAENSWLLMLNSTQQPCFHPQRHFAFPRSRLQRRLVSPDNPRSSAKRICFRWKEGFCLMTSRPKWEVWFPHWQQGRCLLRSTLAPGIASSRASGWMCAGSQESMGMARSLRNVLFKCACSTL